jgi:hypothetical protein
MLRLNLFLCYRNICGRLATILLYQQQAGDFGLEERGVKFPNNSEIGFSASVPKHLQTPAVD